MLFKPFPAKECCPKDPTKLLRTQSLLQGDSITHGLRAKRGVNGQGKGRLLEDYQILLAASGLEGARLFSEATFLRVWIDVTAATMLSATCSSITSIEDSLPYRWRIKKPNKLTIYGFTSSSCSTPLRRHPTGAFLKSHDKDWMQRKFLKTKSPWWLGASALTKVIWVTSLGAFREGSKSRDWSTSSRWWKKIEREGKRGTKREKE